MNALVTQEQRALAHAQQAGRMAVADIISHVSTVQEVMRAVMKPDVHYGKIPGAGDKPTLLKAGAEVLCMVFRIADSYEVTDLSTPDCIRYRVNCIGTHQASGVVMGSGLGEASSNEEKYKWRKAVCKEEWDETPANMRRVKHAPSLRSERVFRAILSQLARVKRCGVRVVHFSVQHDHLHLIVEGQDRHDLSNQMRKLFSRIALAVNGVAKQIGRAHV